jgi:hypothetical protein
MKDSYHVQYQKSSSHQFWFVSNGRKNIIKCVQLDVMDSNRNYFHLSLLDYDENSGLLRDNVVSNNGDTLKIIAYKDNVSDESIIKTTVKLL